MNRAVSELSIAAPQLYVWWQLFYTDLGAPHVRLVWDLLMTPCGLLANQLLEDALVDRLVLRL